MFVSKNLEAARKELYEKPKVYGEELCMGWFQLRLEYIYIYIYILHYSSWQEEATD